MSDLNPQQQEVVLHQGNILVIAGPGTGKTHTITHKILHLLQTGTSPEEVIAITFTNKAAREMKERLKKALHEAALGSDEDALNLPFIGTFHSLCFHLLKNHRTGRFTILTEQQRNELLKSVALELFPQLKQKDLKGIGRHISFSKNQLTSPLPEENKETFQAVFEKYELILREKSLLDFDDLMLQTLQLFKNSPEVQKNISECTRFLFVDEYQDSNEAQYQLINGLVSAKTTLCAIGDPDQAIYSFRGSNVQHFLRFEKDFPQVTVINLQKNYRSTPQILSTAARLIKNNTDRIDKVVITDREPGENVCLYTVENEWKEADFIGREIQRLIGGIDMVQTDRGLIRGQSFNKENIHFSDIAVLVRTRAQTRVIDETFKKAGLPSQVIAGTPWYKRKEIELMLTCLRGLIDAQIELPASLTQALASKITELRSKTEIMLPSEIASEIANSMEFQKDLTGRARNNVMLFISTAFQFDAEKGSAGLNALLAHYALLQDQDAYSEKVQAVSIMTLHAAKGLEFPVVFIAGLEDHILPLQKDGKVIDVQEERRLFYVGITRAKQKLYLLNTRERNGQKTTASPFIGEIQEGLQTEEIHPKRAKKSETSQLSMFA